MCANPSYVYWCLYCHGNHANLELLTAKNDFWEGNFYIFTVVELTTITYN